MWKKILVWGVVLLVVAIAINDTGRYFTGWRVADEAASNAALAAAGTARKDRNRGRAWVTVYNTAAQTGAVAENVEVGDDAVRAWVRYDVRGTWLVGPVIQMTKGVWDLNTWWTTPVPVRSDARSMY